MSNKRCIKCGVEKSSDNFSKDKNRPDGLHSYCKDCCKKANLQYIERNKDNIKAKRKKWRDENKERLKEQDKINYIKFKEKIIQRKKHYARNKRLTDPLFKLKENLRTRCNAIIRAAKINKSKGTLELLGCTPEALKAYLEAKFTDGMSWDNQGKWHIDHIRPCASFDLTDIEQQKQCFHYTNLQPLWASDNIRKGAKWRRPVNHEG